MAQLSTLFVLLTVPAVFSKSDWNYKDDSHKGPQHWKEYCTGKSQSPIDLSSQEETVPLPPLSLADYDQVPLHSLLENNGHAAKLTNKYPSGLTPQISGAGLPNNYKFAQVHFHWGNDSDRGSEHTLDGEAFAMEMHLVHYNANLEDISLASAKDSLAVLGIFFKVSSSDHPGLARLLPYLREVLSAGSQVNVTARLPLSDLVTGDLTQLYRYSGSLTTPGCNEIVQWTVVKTPVEITETQMAEFRQLLTKEKTALVNNFRPTQSLNKRKVLQAETGSVRWCSANHPSVRAASSSLNTFNTFLPILLLSLFSTLS